MATQKIKGLMSIGRISSSDTCSITLQDGNSRIVFARVELSTKDFADAMFGLAMRPVEIEVVDLQDVGKVRKTRTRRVKVSKKLLEKRGADTSRESLEAYAEKYLQKKGWLLKSYLGSQSSVTFQKDSVILQLHYYRYVGDGQHRQP